MAENIAYGRSSATRGQIEAAALTAEAHEFIMALPNGYDSGIGEIACPPCTAPIGSTF